MEKNELIKELLSEVSYRSNEGYPILDKKEHISILAEILDELGLSSIKNELIENILKLNEALISEASILDPKYKPGHQVVVKNK